LGIAHLPDRAPDLVAVGVEDGRDLDPVLGEDRRARDCLAEPAGADQRDVVLPLRPQDLADLAEQRLEADRSRRICVALMFV